jgi:hypothetical protein
VTNTSGALPKSGTKEIFVDGLEKAPEAFIGMLEGRNFGKLIVRVNQHHNRAIAIALNAPVAG